VTCHAAEPRNLSVYLRVEITCPRRAQTLSDLFYKCSIPGRKLGLAVFWDYRVSKEPRVGQKLQT
jgi:hypothetical protein